MVAMTVAMGGVGVVAERAGERGGELGRGVEEGESGWSAAATIGEGEALVDTSGDVALDASPMANVAARNLSSKVDFDLPVG